MKNRYLLILLMIMATMINSCGCKHPFKRDYVCVTIHRNSWGTTTHTDTFYMRTEHEIYQMTLNRYLDNDSVYSYMTCR